MDAMSFTRLSAPAVVTVGVLFISIFIIRWVSASKQPRNVEQFDLLDFEMNLSAATKQLRKELAEALPDSVILPRDDVTFKKATGLYWAQQEREAHPACVVRPRDVQELCTAISLLKRALVQQGKHVTEEKEGADGTGLFAVRSGGHHHAAGAASMKGGVLIDLGLFDKIAISEDGSTVTFGAGLRWKHVFRKLEERGLAISGGRNEDVGVGGFALGSGYSFYSPRYGFACARISSYEVVLESASVAIASASSNPDLWRALKGGSNNFGIVTEFTARTLPATKLWAGFTFHPSNQKEKAFAAFHKYVNRVTISGPDTLYDEHACGPILSFGYVHSIGVTAVALHMAHTNPPEDGKWPECWISSFKPLFKLWNSCAIRNHESASAQLIATNPNGRRQVQATTTIKNDPATLEATHAAWRGAVAELRKHNVKGAVDSLILQPLLPSWATKGDPNMFGLDNYKEPLVLVSFALSYDEKRHDAACEALTRRAIEEIDEFAIQHGTAHGFRFINYAGAWQSVMESYGRENLEFMRDVSRRYDPEGLFQRGCTGGFKLGIKYES